MSFCVLSLGVYFNWSYALSYFLKTNATLPWTPSFHYKTFKNRRSTSSGDLYWQKNTIQKAKIENIKLHDCKNIIFGWMLLNQNFLYVHFFVFLGGGFSTLFKFVRQNIIQMNNDLSSIVKPYPYNPDKQEEVLKICWNIFMLLQITKIVR